MGEFVEAGLQKQKEEGEFSYRRRRGLEDEGKGELVGNKNPSTQSYAVQGETAQSPQLDDAEGEGRHPEGLKFF